MNDGHIFLGISADQCFQCGAGGIGEVAEADVIYYEDGAPYEAAQVLGIPQWRQFTVIMLPYLRKPLISVVFATFTMIITDYGVPLCMELL